MKDDPRYLPTVDKLLRGQAYRERGAAELFEAALPVAPDAAARRRLEGHVAEERAHYARVAAVWSEAFARPTAELDAWVTARLKERPLPPVTSWLELAMAQLLFDRAGRFQIGEYVDSSFAPYRALAREIVDDERGHEDAGASLVVALCAAPGADRSAAQAAFDRWLPVALESFGRPGGDGNAFALAVGLKKHGSAEVARDFLADLGPTLAAAGLRL
ncbi:MAG: phenylacetic acid degradation protein PaaA [Myxococcales bacterium]|nr:phenylacetic acid degradation protein PaaA [Myxococcales bacterium]